MPARFDFESGLPGAEQAAGDRATNPAASSDQLVSIPARADGPAIRGHGTLLISAGTVRFEPRHGSQEFAHTGDSLEMTAEHLHTVALTLRNGVASVRVVVSPLHRSALADALRGAGIPTSTP